jgi:hypothetical protein
VPSFLPVQKPTLRRVVTAPPPRKTPELEEEAEAAGVTPQTKAAPAGAAPIRVAPTVAAEATPQRRVAPTVVMAEVAPEAMAPPQIRVALAVGTIAAAPPSRLLEKEGAAAEATLIRAALLTVGAARAEEALPTTRPPTTQPPPTRPIPP